MIGSVAGWDDCERVEQKQLLGCEVAEAWDGSPSCAVLLVGDERGEAEAPCRMQPSVYVYYDRWNGREGLWEDEVGREIGDGEVRAKCLLKWGIRQSR